MCVSVWLMCNISMSLELYDRYGIYDTRYDVVDLKSQSSSLAIEGASNPF